MSLDPYECPLTILTKIYQDMKGTRSNTTSLFTSESSLSDPNIVVTAAANSPLLELHLPPSFSDQVSVQNTTDTPSVGATPMNPIVSPRGNRDDSTQKSSASRKTLVSSNSSTKYQKFGSLPSPLISTLSPQKDTSASVTTSPSPSAAVLSSALIVPDDAGTFVSAIGSESRMEECDASGGGVGGVEYQLSPSFQKFIWNARRARLVFRAPDTPHGAHTHTHTHTQRGRGRCSHLHILCEDTHLLPCPLFLSHVFSFTHTHTHTYTHTH